MTKVSQHFPGMLASMALYDIRSTIPELVASDALYCGTFVHVEKDSTTGLNTAYTLTDTKQSVSGVCLYNPNVIYDGRSADLLNALKYKKDEPATILTKGDIVMVAEAAVNVNDDVYVRVVADGALTVLNKLSGTTGTGLVKVDGARFVESTSAAGTVIVNINGMLAI